MEFIICVKANQKVRITQIMEFMIYVSHKTYVTTIQKKQVKNKVITQIMEFIICVADKQNKPITQITNSINCVTDKYDIPITQIMEFIICVAVQNIY